MLFLRSFSVEQRYQKIDHTPPDIPYRLSNGRQARLQLLRDRHIVKPGHGKIATDPQPAALSRLNHADGNRIENGDDCSRSALLRQIQQSLRSLVAVLDLALPAHDPLRIDGQFGFFLASQ